MKVSDLKNLITESSNEFKAKLGQGVESDDKKINDKAYSDAKKRAKDFDGGLSDEVGEKKAEYKKEDYNKTLLDYNPDNVTPEYKKRVHAQVKGYSSEKEMNNGLEKTGDFSDNEKIYKELKKSGKEMEDAEKDLKKSGLQAREMPEDTFDEKNMYESREGFDMRKMINNLNQKLVTEEKETPKSVKTVLFKKTEFLNESHMISRIPDDFKNEGTTFKMKDKSGNEYLVEWKNNKPTVLEHKDPNGFGNAISRIKDLYDYKTSDTNTNSTSRLNENDEKFLETLNKMRKII